MSGFSRWLEQINQWGPSGGWPFRPLPQALGYRAPRTACPYCATEGVTTIGEVVAVSVTGGEIGVVWHTVCSRGHAHSFPAHAETGDGE